MAHTAIEVTFVPPRRSAPASSMPAVDVRPRCDNRTVPNPAAPPPPPADALAQVGDRWTLLAIAALLEGPKRFNELKEELNGIAPNVLSARLKALTEHALIVA